MRRTSRMIGWMGVWMSAVCAMAHADGMMMIERPPVDFRRPQHWERLKPQFGMPAPVREMVVLPVTTQIATVKIVDQVATTEIQETFANESQSQLEATYIFPIPDSASITDFQLEIDGKMQDGKVLDRDEAARIYQSYLVQYRDPALLEYIGRKAFRARIFPILPKSERKIKIRYTETLKRDGGLLKYTYPLDTGRFNPTPIGEVAVNVDVTSRKSPIKTVYSPSHGNDVVVSRRGDHRTLVDYEANNVRPDKDFVMYIGLSNDDIGMSLFPFRDDVDDGGFALMVITPAVEDSASSKTLPKDVVFVLDVSGSMKEADRIVQAKKALTFCIGQLNPADRFNLIAFHSETQSWNTALVDVSGDAKSSALKFLDNLVPLGGTNIEEGLTEALAQLTDSTRMQLVVFLTDGLPTVGQTDLKTLLKDVKKVNQHSARIFAFGVGHDVNTYLLDSLAEQHHGTCDYVEPGENIEIKVSNLVTKITSPVLTDVTLEADGVKLKEVFPRPLPDLFRGQQLTVLARYDKPGKATIKLSGKVSGVAKTFTYQEDLPRFTDEHDFVPKLWATRKVGYLLNQIRLHGEDQETVKEIADIGKTYGIVTPYTSYLVEEPNARVGAFRRWGFEEKDAMQMMRAGRAGGPPAPGFTESLKSAQSGQLGVTTAKMAKAYSEAASSHEADALQVEVKESVQQVGKTAFYLKGQSWAPSEYKDQKARQIIYLSDEYFALLKQDPGFKRFFRLGPEATFLHKSQWYQVVQKS